MTEEENEKEVIDAPKEIDYDDSDVSEQSEEREPPVISADEGMAQAANAKATEKKGDETTVPPTQEKILERLDFLKNKLQPAGQQGNTPTPVDPLSEFAVVELKMAGTTKSARKINDRVVHTVMLLSKDQRSQFGKLKVEFYRYLTQISSFRLERKYVVPIRLMSSVEKVYQDLHAEFLNARKDTFDYLENNWDQIADDINKQYPDLLISKAELEDLKPEDIGFVEMDYSVRTLTQMIEEMKELRDLFMKSGINNQYIADRIERQRRVLVEEIRAQYEDKIHRLSEGLEKLTKLKPTTRSYEKTAQRTETLMETVNDMAHVIGEEGNLASRLEEMKQKLAQTGK